MRVVPPEVLGGTLRAYDHHRRRLMLSSLLRPASRSFAAAYQLALFDHRTIIAAEVERAAPPDEGARGLLVTSLANYAAAASLMPYARFHAAAETHRYDVNRLASDFDTSVEQVSHRLTTLGRPALRGVPLFMLRADAAGNISKRFASDAFPFSRFGGMCPRWNLHARSVPLERSSRRSSKLRKESAFSPGRARSSGRPISRRRSTISSPAGSAATCATPAAAAIPTG